MSCESIAGSIFCTPKKRWIRISIRLIERI
uniref:Uncharacterized protein n=1 Tax=Rhizophora mucronata TaxID=61149 RepID=A0A2P2P0I6_RHIMU